MKKHRSEQWYAARELIFSTLVVGLLILFAVEHVDRSAISQISQNYLLAVIILISAAIGLSRWRFAVKTVLYFVIFEGAFRKWVFPEQSIAIYFAKDFVLFFAYLGYLFDSKRKKRIHLPLSWTIFNYLAIILACYCFLEIFNPRLPHLMVGVLGFKSYLFYLPLIYIIKDVFVDAESLVRYLKQMVILAIPIGLLGLLQFLQPTTHPLNRYAWNDIRIADFGWNKYPRITGTFSYISGYTTYLTFVCCLVMAFLMSKRKTIFYLIVLYGVLVLCIGNILMTGSRTPAVQMMITIGLFGLFSARQFIEFIKRYFIHLVVIAVVLVFGVPRLFPEALRSFTERVVSVGSQEAKMRFHEVLRFPELEMELGGLCGYGIGTTHQVSAQYLNYFSINEENTLSDLNFEQEPERVMLEMGYIGFVFYYIFRIFVIGLCFFAWWTVRRSLYASLVFGFSVFILINMSVPLAFNHVLNLLYWFSVGAVLAIVIFVRYPQKVDASKQFP